jgi:phosphoserine phosphatase
MNNVLTLIGNPANGGLPATAVAQARDALAATGADLAATDWLASDLACDIGFDGVAAAAAQDAVAVELGDATLDLYAGPAQGRRKRLLVADMDSTIISVECIDELADFAGKRAQVAAITERAMRGELDFPSALRERALMLAGLDEQVLADAFADRVRLNPGARTLVTTMRAHGAVTALVSGGFTYFTSRVRALAGFDLDRANTLEIADGKLAGRVGEPILGADAKLAALQELTAKHGLAPADTLAVGDGANDLPMIRAAGLGVAYRAKPVVSAAAQARINHADLTGLLYLQGYREDEFKEG